MWVASCSERAFSRSTAPKIYTKSRMNNEWSLIFSKRSRRLRLAWTLRWLRCDYRWIDVRVTLFHNFIGLFDTTGYEALRRPTRCIYLELRSCLREGTHLYHHSKVHQPDQNIREIIWKFLQTFTCRLQGGNFLLITRSLSLELR